MANKRGVLFMTQGVFLLILLYYILLPYFADTTYGGGVLIEWLVWTIYWGVSFFLPGRWWTHLFFVYDTLAWRERGVMSIALSGMFLVFSLLYLPYIGIAYTPGVVLIALTIWTASGIVGVFLNETRTK